MVKDGKRFYLKQTEKTNDLVGSLAKGRITYVGSI